MGEMYPPALVDGAVRYFCGVNSTRVYFREMWQALVARPGAALLGLLGNLIFLAGHLVTPLIIGRIIELAVPGASRDDLWSSVYLWVAVILVSLAAEWMAGVSAADVVSHYSHRMRTRCVATIHAKPLMQRSAGDMTTRMTSDLDMVEGAMSGFIVSGFTDIGRLLMVTIVLLLINPILGFCVIGALVLYAVSLRLTSKSMDDANNERQVSIDDMASKVDETLRTAPVIDAYKVASWDAGRFHERSIFTRRATRMRFLVSWMNNFIGVVVAHLALLVILAVAAISAQNGSTSVAEVAACVIYITGAIESIVLLSPAIPDYQRAGLSIVRVRELLDPDESTQNAEVVDTTHEDSVPAEIAIRDASIVVAGDKTILRDVTLDSPAGQWVTIVGPSGSGKSTVLGLVTGRLAATNGSVTVAGRPVTAKGAPVRSSIVFQDSLLFNASIAENIRVGKLDATDEEVEQAARMAELHDVIAALPDAYDTVIDSSGRSISGGQRQRLALARALVRQPRLLILDEATSALDPETAAAVWRTLRRAARQQGITVLAVCHQLELATDSDRLVVVESGAVVASGSPSELSGDSGPWRSLLDAHNRVMAGDTEAIMRLLKANAHLVPKDEDMLNDLARRSRIKEAELGTEVCRRGEPMDVFILVAAGRMEVSDGSSKFVLGPGSALGGFAELVSGTVDMDAKMVTSGQLVLVPRSAMLPSLLDLMDEEPQLAAAIAWLARVGSATQQELADRIGPGGDNMVDLMVQGKRINRDDEGRVSMVFGARRRGQIDLSGLMGDQA